MGSLIIFNEEIMKKFWLVSFIIEAFLTIIGLSTGILSFVIGLIAFAITGAESNCVSQFCGNILGILVNYVGPVFMFLFVINGLHSFGVLCKETK